MIIRLHVTCFIHPTTAVRTEFTKTTYTYTPHFTVDQETIFVDPDGSGSIPGITRILDRKEDVLN